MDAGFVRRIPDAAKSTVPVQLGDGGSLQGWPVVVFVIGLALVIALWVLKVKGAILISILATTVIAIVIEAIGRARPGKCEEPHRLGADRAALPGSPFDTPDFGTLGEFNLLGSFESVGLVAVVLLVFTLMLADFFDTMGTMTAIGAEAGLLDKEGAPPNTQRILSWTPSPPWPAVPAASRRTPPTSSRRPVSARGRAPGWRRW